MVARLNIGAGRAGLTRRILALVRSITVLTYHYGFSYFSPKGADHTVHVSAALHVRRPSATVDIPQTRKILLYPRVPSAVVRASISFVPHFVARRSVSSSGTPAFT